MQRKGPRRARRRKPSLPVTVLKKTVICISCAAFGKQAGCTTCAGIQPTPLHERAQAARESYAAYWLHKSDLAFAREVARINAEKRA